ncbi:class II fumarate hydratase [Desertibacillus haloalkaliphilus]|uniref:class II fumarate hydratase n=1 Tax=Desertibacillus haloalkaliphilus TaxID=1328930 RepID=UPI001C25E04A|nr:class II fumarate hydratase [Desertibacillus haloalkaliphilus]MBU8907896.1 class II fumarate hydratase [Desertibacillus haloalkaliphilus]
MCSDHYRKEKDTLGEVLVPSEAYYGSQTQRAVLNFQISGKHLPRSFIRAQGLIKAAAAITNMEVGKLPPDVGQAIVDASNEVTEGKWDQHFVIDVYQAGAGTSQNMNANEVIANRATELLAGSLGSSFRVHPNDHVNMAQSTNDTFPSALHIAAAEQIVHQLLPAIQTLEQALETKATEFMSILKSGRTHLHDAVPMRLGQEFSGYAGTIQSMYRALEKSLDSLYELGLGGNAIGTPINTHPDYPQKVITEICRRTNMPFRAPTNIFSFMQNRNAAFRTMSILKELAVHLIKMTSDLRLLSSGPRTGLSEITLPPVQPGSTIMPGKVNPAILEMIHMVSCQVIGYETAIATAGMAGQLEINVMMPVIAHTLLESIELLTNALPVLVSKCINGIQANEEVCKTWMESSLSLVTGLSPSMGYDLAAQIGMQADLENKTLTQVLEELGLMNENVKKEIDPNRML